jgi:hypothetical protein
MLAAMPPRRRTIEEILAMRRPTTLREVLARMRAIDAALPRADGVAWFNKLYLSVTDAVSTALAGGDFRDPRFLRTLDIDFANLFLDALRSFVLRAGPRPKAWEPLIAARSKRGVLPIQFALAGMNAHINRDLPVALVETWRRLGVEPRRPSPQYDDFTRINGLLAETEERVGAWFATEVIGELDRALGRADEVLAIWKVGRAREAAWVNGETLWALRPLPRLGSEFLRTLDRMVGFAGRGLLRPLAVPR